MHKTSLFLTLLVAFVFGFVGCTPADDDSDAVASTEATTSEVSLGAVTVEGIVTGKPLDGPAQPLGTASVTVRKVSEDGYEEDVDVPVSPNGEFTVDLDFGESYVFNADGEGYGLISRRFEVYNRANTNLNFELLPRRTTTFDLPESGDAVEVALGDSASGSEYSATIVIEPGDLSLESAADAAISGAIEVRHIVWDPATANTDSYPGNLFTATEVLTSYGMADIEFFMGDEPVNVRPGQTVGMQWNVNPEIKAGLNSALEAANVFSYTLNHQSGLWELDDSTLSMDDSGILNYERDHFTPVNVDVPSPPPCRRDGEACGQGCCTDDCTGQAMACVNGVCKTRPETGGDCSDIECCSADDMCITGTDGNSRVCAPAN